jgi:hypothetical protein
MNEDYGDRKALMDVRDRVIRIEERQQGVLEMLQLSLSRYADLHNRVTSLENLRHRIIGMLAVTGVGLTLAWELIKQYIWKDN